MVFIRERRGILLIKNFSINFIYKLRLKSNVKKIEINCVRMYIGEIRGLHLVI